MYFEITLSRQINEFIKENSKGLLATELKEKIDKEFNVDIPVKDVRSRKKRLKAPSGLDTKFKKGHECPNKGNHDFRIPGGEKYQFKKGNKPHNTQPIGTEKIADGYTLVKLADNHWKQKHRIIYEKEIGPLNGTDRVIFLDGNKQNCNIDNLEKVTMSELHYLNTHKLLFNDPDKTRSAVIIARTYLKARELEKNGNS